MKTKRTIGHAPDLTAGWRLVMKGNEKRWDLYANDNSVGSTVSMKLVSNDKIRRRGKSNYWLKFNCHTMDFTDGCEYVRLNADHPQVARAVAIVALVECSGGDSWNM